MCHSYPNLGKKLLISGVGGSPPKSPCHLWMPHATSLELLAWLQAGVGTEAAAFLLSFYVLGDLAHFRAQKLMKKGSSKCRGALSCEMQQEKPHNHGCDSVTLQTRDT